MPATDEYRVPTDEEWAEFLGHFERRKIATGIFGRAFGTPCIHEHSCGDLAEGPTAGYQAIRPSLR
jgi:hypothetical protein